MKAEGVSAKTWLCVATVLIALRLPEIITAVGAVVKGVQ